MEARLHQEFITVFSSQAAKSPDTPCIPYITTEQHLSRLYVEKVSRQISMCGNERYTILQATYSFDIFRFVFRLFYV